MRHFIASYTLHIFFGCAIIVIAEARKGMVKFLQNVSFMAKGIN